MTADVFLTGDEGFWEHWRTALTERPDAPGGPLRMDVIVEPDFAERAWLAELDPAVVSHVVENAMVAGRVIVPPETLESPAEALVELAIGIGFEVRVATGLTACAIYDARAVVLPESDEAGRAGHRLIRRPSVVEPLVALFELHWAAAIAWREYLKGAAGVLHLLALGWSDARIAAALGISGRTVSRRVAEAMTSAGVHSRFQLGMRYARTAGENTTTLVPGRPGL
ncbi:MAG TPA: helix-turn-helix transcriptional regulator [Microbacteriaceae bacterium]|nr:helix-turn-helix transcriptional regulator [Microbacteriaceae bacterium]